jgi:hypothetical protein
MGLRHISIIRNYKTYIFFKIRNCGTYHSELWGLSNETPNVMTIGVENYGLTVITGVEGE